MYAEKRIHQVTMSTLTSPHFELHCEPERGSFSLLDKRSGVMVLSNARISIASRQMGKTRRDLTTGWQVRNQQIEIQTASLHGPLNSLRLEVSEPESELTFTLTFALSQAHPLFLWKIALSNQGSQPLEIERIELLRAGGQDSQGHFQLSQAELPRYSFFSNGWQSWSYCGTYLPNMAMRTTNLGRLQKPSVINPGTPDIRQSGYFTADFFGAVGELESRAGLLLGFLSQKQHFGTIEAFLYDRCSLRLWANGDSARLDPGTRMETDWAVITPFGLEDADPFGEYLQAVVREHELRPDRETPVGWCSWYHYFTKITPENLRANLDELTRLRGRLPLEGFQIDDGFQAEVGDWFEFKPAFPDGVEPLAREIKAAGFNPGLWLAPFILHPSASIVSDHPDWLLRDAKGRPVNCGFGWNALTRALDLTVPDALDYARRVVDTAVHQWGYPYIKLDFLYAAAVNGRYNDPTRTRAQVLRGGMQALRDAAGEDAFLVGCGAPLGSVIGLVDAMRIGEDVSPDWYPHIFGIGLGLRREPFLPSVRNAVHNSLTRSALHRRWWINDPDCLLVRPSTNLTLAEVQTLASAIAITGGSLLVSDNLAGLPEERRRIIEVLLPLIGERPQVIDLFDKPSPSRTRLDLRSPSGAWHVLACFNWQDQPLEWKFNPQDYRLESGSYLLRSFWDGVIQVVHPGEQPAMPALPAHGVCVLAIRQRISGEAQYAGSDLHISQGLEASMWQPSAAGLALELNLPRQTEGHIYLSLPRQPRRIECSGEELDWSEVLPGIYQIRVAFDQKAGIQVLY